MTKIFILQHIVCFNLLKFSCLWLFFNSFYVSFDCAYGLFSLSGQRPLFLNELKPDLTRLELIPSSMSPNFHSSWGTARRQRQICETNFCESPKFVHLVSGIYLVTKRLNRGNRQGIGEGKTRGQQRWRQEGEVQTNKKTEEKTHTKKRGNKRENRNWNWISFTTLVMFFSVILWSNSHDRLTQNCGLVCM